MCQAMHQNQRFLFLTVLGKNVEVSSFSHGREEPILENCLIGASHCDSATNCDEFITLVELVSILEPNCSILIESYVMSIRGAVLETRCCFYQCKLGP